MWPYAFIVEGSRAEGYPKPQTLLLEGIMTSLDSLADSRSVADRMESLRVTDTSHKLPSLGFVLRV